MRAFGFCVGSNISALSTISKAQCHSSRPLTLPLFVAGIRANDVNTSSPTNHFAVLANPLHACTDLHRSTSRITWIGSGKADEYKGRGSKSSRAVQPISKKKSRTGFYCRFSMLRLPRYGSNRASASAAHTRGDRPKPSNPVDKHPILTKSRLPHPRRHHSSPIPCEPREDRERIAQTAPQGGPKDLKMVAHCREAPSGKRLGKLGSHERSTAGMSSRPCQISPAMILGKCLPKIGQNPRFDSGSSRSESRRPEESNGATKSCRTNLSSRRLK